MVNLRRKRGQVAIEFVMLSIMGFLILFGAIISLGAINSEKKVERTYIETEDLGRSIQEEIILAADLETGYERKFTLPGSLSGVEVNYTIGNTSINTSYIKIDSDDLTKIYEIPLVHGTIVTGTNTIKKENGTIRLN